MKIHLSHQQIRDLCRAMVMQINAHFEISSLRNGIRVFGIPRGGVPVAYMLEAVFPDRFVTTEDINVADIAVDDIIDSGATMRRWCDKHPTIPFFALIDKTTRYAASGDAFKDSWIVFPWERNDNGDEGIEDNVVRLLQYIGEDPSREGLLETPKRVVKAYAEWFDGYKTDIPALFKTFTDGAENCDEVIIVDSIPVESFCEHHMARFHGLAHVGYIPDGKIIGLSKIPKLVRAFSHRLQVQERLTNQIASTLIEHLRPKGVAVVLRCEHTCMCSRGAKVHGTMTTTSAMRGAFLDKPEARAEFFSLIPAR